MQQFEKLGEFYLGKTVDPATRQHGEDFLLYDSKDLTTHAICVGMTGSGKTGLCIGVLEEAAIDGIPAIVIDPKGDMTNLLLSFPDLSPADFEPWVSSEEAQKKGLSTQNYAALQADMWQKGLSDWGQDGQRIKAMREKTQFEIYTPGSSSGKPLSIVTLFSLPPDAIRNDAEALNDLVAGTTASLLGLLGIEADPIRSREHILISNILLSAWKGGTNLDLAGLIQQIQTPPFNQIGVMTLDSFYPAKDRFDLALQFNNLLASPSFSAWMQGEPLSIDQLLYTGEGKPKISILSIAHLSDSERMFFVSLVLNQMVGWVRSQPGTSSLRALLYMDEIYGYFPPVANPPSKAPLLTLLKQARAFGLGVMLTTQNPMDLDYKGLANMGTWFIGRLQTDRDKSRLLDGLEGASMTQGSSFDRQTMDQLISSLGSRIFLMNNVHEDSPVLFETRWCMSYLKGPLTRTEIQTLSKANRNGPAAGQTVDAAAPDMAAPAMAAPAASESVTTSAAAAASTPVSVGTSNAGLSNVRPQLPDNVAAAYLPYRGDSAGLTYRACLAGFAEIHYEDAKNGISASVEEARVTPVSTNLIPVDWNLSEILKYKANDLESTGAPGAAYQPLSPACDKKTSYTDWEKELADYLFRNSSLELFRNEHLKKVSRPDETERDFQIRLQQESREERDREVAKLRETYVKKAASLEEKIRRAEQSVEREKDQAKDAKVQTAISLGSTILGALFGRKAVSASNIGKVATTARGASRTLKQSGDVSRSEETVKTFREQLAEIENDLQAEIDEISARLEANAGATSPWEIRPLKRDCVVKALALTWEPVRTDANGTVIKAWQ